MFSARLSANVDYITPGYTISRRFWLIPVTLMKYFNHYNFNVENVASNQEHLPVSYLFRNGFVI